VTEFEKREYLAQGRLKKAKKHLRHDFTAKLA